MIYLVQLWTNAVAEIFRLVHVKPDSRERHLLPEVSQPFAPEILNFAVKEVNKNAVDRPYLSNKVFPIHLYKRASILVVRIQWVVLSDCEARVDDWHHVDVALLESFNSFCETAELEGIDSERLIVVLVVDINPLSI